MTTTIKVSAHCDKDTFVVVEIHNSDGKSTSLMQDGEEQQFYIYDTKKLTVQEVPRKEYEIYNSTV